MPYILKGDGRREALQRGESALTAGELNYQIFYYIKHYGNSYPSSLKSINLRKNIKRFVDNFLGEKPNYQKYNDMTGCLVRCAKEIKRRLNQNANFLFQICNSYDDEIAKYEDQKIQSNGDVE